MIRVLIVLRGKQCMTSQYLEFNEAGDAMEAVLAIQERYKGSSVAVDVISLNQKGWI